MRTTVPIKLHHRDTLSSFGGCGLENYYITYGQILKHAYLCITQFYCGRTLQTWNLVIKMSENGEIYTAGKNLTLPPALTAWTNSILVHRSSSKFMRGCLQCYMWVGLDGMVIIGLPWAPSVLIKTPHVWAITYNVKSTSIHAVIG